MFALSTGIGKDGYRMTTSDLIVMNRSMKQIFKIQGILMKEFKNRHSKLSKERLLEYREKMKSLLERTKIYKEETSLQEKSAYQRELRIMTRLICDVTRDLK